MTVIYKSCDKCNGQGKVQDAFAPCPHCTNGSILVGGQSENCPYCSGIGRQSPPPWVDCSTCKGSGQVRDTPAERAAEAATNQSDRSSGTGGSSDAGKTKPSPKRFLGGILTFRGRLSIAVLIAIASLWLAVDYDPYGDIFRRFGEERGFWLTLLVPGAFGFLFPRAVLTPVLAAAAAFGALFIIGILWSAFS